MSIYYEGKFKDGKEIAYGFRQCFEDLKDVLEQIDTITISGSRSKETDYVEQNLEYLHTIPSVTASFNNNKFYAKLTFNDSYPHLYRFLLMGLARELVCPYRPKGYPPSERREYTLQSVIENIFNKQPTVYKPKTALGIIALANLYIHNYSGIDDCIWQIPCIDETSKKNSLWGLYYLLQNPDMGLKGFNLSDFQNMQFFTKDHLKEAPSAKCLLENENL